MNVVNHSKLPLLCKSLRTLLNKTIPDVASDVGVSAAMVYAFERGASKDMRVLMWYMHHDLELYAELVEDFYNEDK